MDDIRFDSYRQVKIYRDMSMDQREKGLQEFLEALAAEPELLSQPATREVIVE